MASTIPVPDSVDIGNMTGVYTLNKTLSSPTDAVLRMQKVGWLIRQAVAYSNVTVTIRQYTDAEDRLHLDTEQVSTGGIRSNEERTLDWTWRDKSDTVFGKVRGRVRLVKLVDVEGEVEFLKEGLEGEGEDRLVLENQTCSLTDDWTAQQIWGFGIVDGTRRRLQNAIVSKPSGEIHKVTIVYDWKCEI
ncbi:hypothetical protein K431DRAFT_283126 [Polychaeton citri CBS 116435]|uniref:Uncharacterized protein n=1 Tax=Polychaeton citri CBS 116435 TaxID=1314669 RepID=A0A9P4QBU5_9PEZI|nr:hypothetical protein K431DRAFT_283126 [Polychaeton citri CBS 116435]